MGSWKGLCFWSDIPSSTFDSSVTLGKFMDLSEPQFPDQNYKCIYLVSEQSLESYCLTA